MPFYTESEFVSRWLASSERDPSPYPNQRVNDVSEGYAADQNTVSGMVTCLLTARFDLDFLAEASADYGWDNVHEIVSTTRAKGGTADVRRRGEFGEVLMGLLLETVHSWDIPVNKLRFAIREGQPFPATDVLALASGEDGEISGVCYAEAKLRTSADRSAPLLGYRQLRDDYEARLPEILPFIAQRLREFGHPFYEPFRGYMRTRQDNRNLDHFHLCLVYDADVWDEASLQNLEDEGIEISPLLTEVVQIGSLRVLTDRCFQELGAATLIEDD